MVQYVNIDLHYYIIEINYGTLCEYKPPLLHNKSNLRTICEYKPLLLPNKSNSWYNMSI